MAEQTDSQPLATPREAAQLLSVSERTLWTLTSDGKIPHVRIGRCKRYDRRDLDDWIQSQKQVGTGRESNSAPPAEETISEETTCNPIERLVTKVTP